MKERILHLFVQEVIKQKCAYEVVNGFKQGKKNVMELLYIFNDIDRSLYWAETTQGHEFWNKVNNKSKSFLRKYLYYAN